MPTKEIEPRSGEKKGHFHGFQLLGTMLGLANKKNNLTPVNQLMGIGELHRRLFSRLEDQPESRVSNENNKLIRQNGTISPPIESPQK